MCPKGGLNFLEYFLISEFFIMNTFTILRVFKIILYDEKRPILITLISKLLIDGRRSYPTQPTEKSKTKNVHSKMCVESESENVLNVDGENMKREKEFL
jgi:hypothetical protein